MEHEHYCNCGKVDWIVLNWIQFNFKNGILDRLMPWITYTGNGGIIWILLSIILTCTKKYRIQGLLLVLSFFLELFFVELALKPLVHRYRPYTYFQDYNLLIGHLKVNASFPSGHTALAFAASGILIRFNKYLGISAFVYAFIIAFSRLYLMVHFPSDVLFGMILGIIISQTVYLIFHEKINNFLNKRIGNKEIINRNKK